MAWRRSRAHELPLGVMANFVQHVYNTVSFRQTAVCPTFIKYSSNPLTLHRIAVFTHEL
jgi:hypothetical protein